MTSSLFKHALIVVGILFFVMLFLIPAAHYRPTTPLHGRWFSTSGLVAVLHSLRSFIRTRSSSAESAVAAIMADVSSLSRLFVSIGSDLSESGLALLYPILRC